MGQTLPSQKSGTLWIKAKTKTSSGQFPSEVKISGPDQVKMVVLNPLGGTEALIRVEGPKLSVKTFSSGEAEKERLAHETWNGVPIRWMGALLLGRVPCPGDFSAAAWDSDGRLVVAEPRGASGQPERFEFTLAGRDDGELWVERLVWERGAGDTKRRVEVGFSRTAEKWEIHSDQGELALRWRQ